MPLPPSPCFPAARCAPLAPTFCPSLSRHTSPRPSRRCAVTPLATAKLPNKELLEVAQRAASAGAAIVLDRVDKPRSISYKGATDLVTDTDQASEDAILAAIREAYPDHALLGEEGGVSGDTSSEYLWVVDPLDGTTNFAHGYPSFAVCVACLRHALPVAATVVEFAGGPGTWVTRTYSAARYGGAFLNGTPITVSRTHDLQKSLLVTGFGYEHDEAWLANIGLFKEFTDVTQGVRRLGSAAIDMCHVASGTFGLLLDSILIPRSACQTQIMLKNMCFHRTHACSSLWFFGAGVAGTLISLTSFLISAAVFQVSRKRIGSFG
jgi:myo-inositol-1(or 4)-monophosphatase